jgi:hypothetical protein
MIHEENKKFSIIIRFAPKIEIPFDEFPVTIF